MSNHANLTAALLSAFNLDADKAEPAVTADALATVLVAFADLVRGPAPVVAELAAAELAPLPDQAELIAEVRTLTEEIRHLRHLIVTFPLPPATRIGVTTVVGAGAGANNSSLPG